MTTISCPHVEPAERNCDGCLPVDSSVEALARGVLRRACDGEVSANVVQDSQGDGVWSSPLVIIEDQESSCTCVLTREEAENLAAQLVVAAVEQYEDD